MLRSNFYARSDSVELVSAFEASKIELDSITNKGDPKRRGGVYEHYCCQITISEIEEWPDHLKEMLRFVEVHRTLLEELKRRGAEFGIDIGMTVGGDRHYTRSLELPPSAMKAFASEHLSIEVSSYPCSDD